MPTGSGNEVHAVAIIRMVTTIWAVLSVSGRSGRVVFLSWTPGSRPMALGCIRCLISTGDFADHLCIPKSQITVESRALGLAVAPYERPARTGSNR